MRKIKSIVALLFCACITVFAQENKPVSISFEARGDYQRTYIDDETIKDESGFKGNIVNVILKGSISDKFSYAYRQRLNGINKDNTFFDATDWLYLDYKATDNIKLSAGKQIVLVGGWELEAAPIDCYFLSEYCYNFPCYQWGVSTNYTTSDGKDNLTLQVCQSPFRKHYSALSDKGVDTYAYNIMWQGNHGFFEPLWSVNMMEYAPGKYINYISLGNKLHIGDRIQVDLDFMNRAVAGHTFFGRDCSFVGRVSYQPIKQLNVFAKVSYDVNKTDSDADICVMKGTEITRLGCGFEYFPLKNNKVRIHGNYSYSFGNNTNPEGTLVDKLSVLNLGLTWRMKVL